MGGLSEWHMQLPGCGKKGAAQLAGAGSHLQCTGLLTWRKAQCQACVVQTLCLCMQG